MAGLDDRLLSIEDEILRNMGGLFWIVTDVNKRNQRVRELALRIEPLMAQADIDKIVEDMNNFYPIAELLVDEDIEDIMINHTEGIFAFNSRKGLQKLEEKLDDREVLSRFVAKLKLYMTNTEYDGNVMDIHLPNGSRANVVSSPLGQNITIRNMKRTPLSIIDLINNGTMDYDIAARLWLYVDGLKVRPANLLIGGIPAAGKTTLLNAMFSFFRPDQRIVTIEETYELDTSEVENCAALETSKDLPMQALVKNALRMRPDLVIIGEVRGAEANDMITAINIGKISMGTIHGATSRDIINRLQHTPMNVPMDIMPVIDAIVVVSSFYSTTSSMRKVTQISEISGLETQVLLSDLYKYDYKTGGAAPILPSVTYRDMLSNLVGITPQAILAEERVRAMILEKMNGIGKRDIRSISETVKAYYDNPDATLHKLDIRGVDPVVKV